MTTAVAPSPWRLEGGLFRAPALAAAGLPHGVSSRSLGNMKEPSSRAAALAAAGLPGREALLLRQVHGTAVVTAPGPREPEADGWLCATPGTVCGVYAADCLPIFVWDQGRAAVGVFHAGWRGLAGGMAREAVAAFGRAGIAPGRLGAAVGPHIGADHYRVGADVAERFHARARVEGPDGTRLDLGAEAAAQLVEAGMAPEAVTVSSDCTACRAGDLFSYRREGKDNRMLAFIALS